MHLRIIGNAAIEVTRRPGDTRAATTSGFWYMLRNALNASEYRKDVGREWVKVREPFVLSGMHYALRRRNPVRLKAPRISVDSFVVDHLYAIRCPAKVYNEGKVVELSFHKEEQT